MNQQVNTAVNQDYEDDIDLGQLFDKIWQQRKFIVSSVFIGTLIVVAWLGAMHLLFPPTKEYSLVIQFNFSGAASGTYPSGQRYSSSDILAPKVMDEVYRRNELDDKNIDKTTFINAFSVSPFASNIDFIDKKYASLLADGDLTRPEIERIELQYLQELSAAQSKYVKIAYIENRAIGLDRVVVEKVLNDIPKVWAQQAINEQGVLALKFAGTNFYERKMTERFEYVKILDYFGQIGGNLKSALQVLAEDEIGGFVKNNDTGQTAFDLLAELESFVEFEVQPLFDIFTKLGIVKSKFKSQLYLENTILDLNDQKRILEKKQKNYQVVLDSYLQLSVGPTTADKGVVNADNTGFTQFDAGLFDRITSLIEDKSDFQFKQDLLNKRLIAMQQIEDIDGKLLKLNRAMEFVENQNVELRDSIRQEYVVSLDLVETKLLRLIDEYKLLLDYRNTQALGNSSSLYELDSGQMKIQTGFRAFVKSVIIIGGIAAVFSLLLAVSITLIRRPRNENKMMDTAL